MSGGEKEQPSCVDSQGAPAAAVHESAVAVIFVCHTAHRITRLILQHGHLNATRTVFWSNFQRVVAQQLMW
jgi:hypothetical protein